MPWRALHQSTIKRLFANYAGSVSFLMSNFTFAVMMLICLYTLSDEMKKSHLVLEVTLPGSLINYQNGVTNNLIDSRHCKTISGSSRCGLSESAVDINNSIFKIRQISEMKLSKLSLTTSEDIHFEDLKISLPKFTANWKEVIRTPDTPDASINLEPTSTSNGSITTYKFPATMDAGILGCGSSQIGANESLMRLEYGGPPWFKLCNDVFYIFYGEYRKILQKYTANQLVSARQVFTWNSGTLVDPKSVLSGLVTSPWSEGTVLYKSPPTYLLMCQSSLSSMAGLSPGSSFSVNSIECVKEHFNGQLNNGFTLERSSWTASREEGVGEGAPRIHTRDAVNPEYRPFLEVIIDTSRAPYPAPVDPPSGLTLTTSVGGLILSWASTPLNTTQVIAEFSCSVSGATRIPVAAVERKITHSGLQSGERCTARAQSLNSGGASPFSMSSSEVTVQGTAPSTGPSLSISASGATVTTSLLSTPSSATEFIVTLSCSQSGQKLTTLNTTKKSNTFIGLIIGENCSAFATSKNEWGNSAPGAVTNSVTLQGNLPTELSFVAESVQPLQLRISWNLIPTGATSIDAVITCSKSGLFRRSSNPSAMSILLTGLSGGESCLPSITATNQYGSSAASNVGGVRIQAALLEKPLITGIDVSVATKATIRWVSPNSSEIVEFIVRCPGMSDYLFSSPATNNSRNIIGGEPGTTCTILARATNPGATSSYTEPYAFTFRGFAPTVAPQGVNIIAGSNSVTVQWSIATDATQVIIELNCSKTGRQTISANAIIQSISFKASSGDSCYATLGSINIWGTSNSKSTTKSVSLKADLIATKKSTPAPVTSTKKTAEPAKPKSTLICIKESRQLTIVAESPKCPTGWTKKPTITKQ